MVKRLLITLGLLLLATPGGLAAQWFTDVPTALTRAKTENKTVLLDFTGSDWCGWCMRLKKEVFDQPEFAAYAQANLILVEVDFPRHKTLSREQKLANTELAQKYGIEGFPTIVVLNAAGRRLGATGYLPGGPARFISQLQGIPGVGRSTVPTRKSDAPGAPAVPPAVPAVAAPDPASHARGLFLKGVSGTPGRRLALINNQTIMAGETAGVKVGNDTIAVTVKTVANNSAVVIAEGQTFELTLAAH